MPITLIVIFFPEGESCRLRSDGSQGVCTSIKRCPEVLTAPGSTPQLCMFVRSDPIVCCPQSNNFPQDDQNDFNIPSSQSSFNDQSGFVNIRDGDGTIRVSQRSKKTM
uniref:Uncharacterized protein n=1 Tax=Phlebotomus papatasi TaxID=29031 RepID=A0A1B0DHV5_PHLPP